MKRSIYILYILIFLLTVSCNNTSSTSSSSQTSTQANVAPSPPKKVKSNGVTVAAKKANAKSGEDVCVDVQVKGFLNVVSMQYSFNWNPSILKFKEVKGFNLKDLSAANFGVHVVKDGKMTFSWYDQAVKGITLDDKTVIHQICYTALGKGGTKGKIQITEDPIIVEITNNENKQMKFFTETGSVSIK